MEWPTITLAVAIHAAWLGLTWFHDAIAWPFLLAGGAWLAAWHSSLQHELIHGHPTRWPAFNRALGLWPMLPHLPFDRYRAIHLAHHRDHFLTDPLEDPETQYFSLPAWDRLGAAGRVTARIVARLAGRLVIGPVWAIGRFLWRDAQRAWDDIPGVRRAWAWHLPILALMLAWVLGVCGMSLGEYTLCFWLPGMALLLMRSLAEHRAADPVEHRTAIVERAPVLGLLYLFNNLHAAHHERPSLAWYRLPGWYAQERARLIERNGGLVYRGYAEVVRRFLLQPHDQAVHPSHQARSAAAEIRETAGSLTLEATATA